MKDKVKVSVIIPVYRVENYLERAVDSVLAQTLQELEIILVDDGSDDTSPQICDRYAREYPDRIQVIHKENEGLGLARNTGVRAASGEYIAFLDSDDSVSAEMYESLYQKAVQDDADIVMCDVQIIYVEENKTSVSVSYPEEEIDLSDYIANGNNITYSVNKLFRRRILEENPYRKMLFEDISLIPALVTQCRTIGYVPQPFYQYYRRANTISTSLVGDMVDIVEAFRDFIRHSDPSYREEVIYNIAKQLLWNMTQSRVLFQADFAELLQEYKADFLLNPYIQKDKRVKKILEGHTRKPHLRAFRPSAAAGMSETGRGGLSQGPLDRSGPNPVGNRFPARVRSPGAGGAKCPLCRGICRAPIAVGARRSGAGAGPGAQPQPQTAPPQPHLFRI